MIIDSHIHISSPGLIRNPDSYRRSEPYFDLLCSSPKNKLITADELTSGMGMMGIDCAIVFGFGFLKMDNCREANDYTIESVKNHPEKLIGFATVNPGSPDVEDELERCYKNGLKGVGEIMPEGQKIDITDKKTMNPLCCFCKEHDWPVLVHLNELVGHYYPGKTPDSITQGAALVENFPDTTFIFAHLGGGLCFYETMPEMRKMLKNVYYDTAAVPFLYENRIYDVLKSAGVIDKVLFGSDYPLLSPLVYKEVIDSGNLSGTDRKKLFSDNLNKLIK
jgi:uncharacterized protein